MGSKLRELQLDGAIIAVDTWLGSSEHWTTQQWFDSLAFETGRPALQKKFMANMVATQLTDHVVPLPLDSLNAAQLLKEHNLPIDLVHLDGGHDYASVSADLRVWWPLLRPGGILIGDDYNTNGVWPEVRQAFDDYFGALGLMPFDVAPPKCRVRKPTQERSYELLEPATSDGLRRIILGAPPQGSDAMWHPSEGGAYGRYRWMASPVARWDINIPATPSASLQIKVPFMLEASPGIAEGTAVTVGGHRAELSLRDSAIFARVDRPPTGSTTVELTLSDSGVPDAWSEPGRLGLAVSVIA
jgi:hypothetical protein